MEAFIEYRGPAAHFHGRNDVIGQFIRALKHYRKQERGTIFLIKGPPGSGKTALLSKLSEHAITNGYAVKGGLNALDFHDPARMAAKLGVRYTPRKTRMLNIGVKWLGSGGKKETEMQSGVVDIIRKVSSPQGLVLVFDEAQHLAKLADRGDEEDRAMATLDMIHNGEIGAPVILLAGGLGTTEFAFESLGISRFEESCRVRLGPLDPESTHAVIKDHLMHQCGLDSPPQNWIESLAEQTHGWPHHIMCYVESSKECLAASNHKPTHEALQHSIAMGWERQVSYYNVRAHGITKNQRRIIAGLFEGLPIGATVEKEDIIWNIKEQYSDKEANEVFERALRQA
ncbi:MAG: AAA family ATPase [Bacteroidetes bacterium]|nr:AAA family ATPase [Bacteroidota bacterium]MCY4234637.1 AAA family ATPase [Bacteroidota bacterium]